MFAPTTIPDRADIHDHAAATLERADQMIDLRDGINQSRPAFSALLDEHLPVPMTGEPS